MPLASCRKQLNDIWCASIMKVFNYDFFLTRSGLQMISLFKCTSDVERKWSACASNVIPTTILVLYRASNYSVLKRTCFLMARQSVYY